MLFFQIFPLKVSVDIRGKIESGGEHAHCGVDFVDGETAVDTLERGRGVLERIEGLLVDVGGLDGRYLALEIHDLR